MKKVNFGSLIISSVFTLLIFSSCKTIRSWEQLQNVDTVINNDTVIIVDTLYFGIDNVEAYFECDSEKKVILKQYDELMQIVDTMKPIERIRVVTKINNNDHISYVVKEKPVVQVEKVIPGWLYVTLIIIGLLCITLLLALLK